MTEKQIFKLIEKHCCNIEESTKNGIVAHQLNVDDFTEELITEIGKEKREGYGNGVMDAIDKSRIIIKKDKGGNYFLAIDKKRMRKLLKD